jgi:Tfp pilus assembly protein PilF/peroxiredoxin
VEVRANNQDGKQLVKTLRAGGGFLSQSSKWMHFGLGQASQIELVTVRWPGGEAEDFTDIQLNGRYLLVQGTGRASMQSTRKQQQLALTPSLIDLPKLGSSTVRLSTLPPMPRRIRFQDFDGSTKEIPIGQGQPVLVSLWASWCPPCLAELQEFSTRADEFRKQGVGVIALSVDGLGKDQSDAMAAPRFLSNVGFPFPSGRAEAEFIRLIQGFHNRAVVLKHTLPIPTSILIDGKGRLATIYKGRLQLDELWDDVAQLQQTGVDRWVQSAPLAGRAVDHESVVAVRRSDEARLRMEFAEALDEGGRRQLAAEHYRELLVVAPKLAKAHWKLADIYTDLKQPSLAVEHYRQGIQLEPNLAVHHYNLGNLLNHASEYDEAITCYRRAIELKNDYLEAHVNLGSVYFKMERYAEAVTEFEHALQINPNFAPARQNLERVQTLLQRPSSRSRP